MAQQTVPLYTVTSGDRVDQARTSLAEALGEAKLGDVDEAGAFEVAVDAESPEAARELVREAFARAGTGDDFVIRETTEGREIADDDPRQAGSDDAAKTAAADRAARVADAASAVAAAATSAASGEAAEKARSAAADAADSVRAAASSAREAVDEKGVGGAASDYATQAQESRWAKFAPLGGALVLLWLVRRARR